jgi:hypothetical protein
MGMDRDFPALWTFSASASSTSTRVEINTAPRPDDGYHLPASMPIEALIVTSSTLAIVAWYRLRTDRRLRR